MDNKTWTIVQFLEDNSVEAIPTCWIQGDYCYWPPYKQEKLTNSIKRYEPVNFTWRKHSIKIFKNAKFDDYKKARSKAKDAEDCSASDLLSEKEDGKRKRVQKTLSTSASSEENSPKLPVNPPKPPKVTKKISALETNMVENIEQIEEQNNNISQEFYHQTANKSSNQCSNETTPRCCFHEEHRILQELKAQNHMMRGILTDVLSELKELKIKGLNNEVSTSIFVKYPDIGFPIMLEEDFSTFETNLKNEKDFNEAVNELAKFGGSNPYDFVKRAMSAILSDAILVKYSWLGRKAKKRLEGTTTSKLIISAADKTGMGNQKLVEDAIKSYIKRAPERMSAKENKKQ